MNALLTALYVRLHVVLESQEVDQHRVNPSSGQTVASPTPNSFAIAHQEAPELRSDSILVVLTNLRGRPIAESFARALRRPALTRSVFSLSCSREAVANYPLLAPFLQDTLNNPRNDFRRKVLAEL